MLRAGSILFATDLSDCSARAYTYAAELAHRLEAELHVVHVYETASHPPGASGRLAPALESAQNQRYPFAAGAVRNQIEAEVASESIPDGIVRYASQHDVALIVIGARGNGGTRKPLVGSVARLVVQHAPCPVLMVRDSLPYAGIRRVLVPVDFSDHAGHSLREAAALAATWNASLDLLHVVPSRKTEASFAMYPSAHPAPDLADEWEARLHAFAVEALEEPMPAFRTHVRVGPAAPTIINFALEHSPDLIVIATHGQTASSLAAMGAVANAVSRCPFCPVLTLRSLPDAPSRGARPTRGEMSSAKRRAPAMKAAPVP